jgi:tetratricopeptide (TPR) repeat protein
MASQETATPQRAAPVAPPPRPGVSLQDRLRAALFLSPSFLPALACIGIFLWFAGDEGGFLGTTFLPGSLIVLALLCLSLTLLPRPRPPRPVVLAVGLLAGYAAWSYLSLLWAGEPGLAWDGANRTVLYALVFAVFALWPVRGGPATVLLGAYGLGVALIAGVELVRASAASDWIQYFHEGRLSEPAGYANANVALWFSAFFPCLVFAGRKDVPPALRGLFLGGAGLLASASVLGQSRAWFFVLPVMIVLAVAVVPGRGRTIAAMVAVIAGVALVLGPLLDVYDAFRPGAPPGPVFRHAVRAAFFAGAALGAVGYLAALADRLLEPSALTVRRINAAVMVAFALACAGGVVGFAAVKGHPVSRVTNAWKEFKTDAYEPSGQKTRFGTSLANHRWDYWRVSWVSFKEHPLIGEGSDNYGRTYLKKGRTLQTPRYPHSVELRALSETGLIGGLLLGGALVAALAGAVPALRRPDLAGAAAGAGMLMFAYWMVHGSFDWLWEFPGLGGPAFAGLGIAVAVAQGRSKVLAPGAALLAGHRTIALAGAAALLLAAAIAVPWLSERDLRKARKEAATDPNGALRLLDRASSLNPLSPIPDETAGVIQLRLKRTREAGRSFRRALDRDPGEPFSLLQLGTIASVEGRRGTALALVGRAHRIDPRDSVIADSLRTLRRGRRLDPQRVNAGFLRDIDERIGPG